MSLVRYAPQRNLATNAFVLGTAAAAGTAGTVPRTDDTIAAFDATAPTTSAVGDAAAVGTVARAARRDHAHGREAFATNAVVLGTAAAAGAATTLIRSDATIAAFDATAPTTSAVADAAAVGTIAFAARRDHRHGREAFGSPVNVAATAADGTAVTVPRGDHVHALGIVTTKGDVLTYSTVPARLPVGTNTQVLTADSTTATGLAWSSAGAKEIQCRPGEAHFPDTGFADLARVAGTNIPYLIIQFDDTAIEEAYWVFAVPSNYSGNVTATIYWKGAATTNAVRWGVSLRSVGDGGTWDSTWTETAANDTAAGTAELLNTLAITATAPFTASQMGQMRLRRVANDAADTFVGDAKLVGVVLSW